VSVARLVAQRGDEAVREVSAQRLFEPLERGLLGSTLGRGESREIRKDPRRCRGSDLREYGGTHGTGIGPIRMAFDPWRE